MDAAKLYLGDCFYYLPEIPDGSIDLLFADLPYGTTNNYWDRPLDLAQLWPEYNRVLKRNGAAIFTASQPFTTKLIVSNWDHFRYTLVWDKTKPGNFALAKKRPLKSHEDLVVFYREQPTYNPQMEIRGRVRKKGGGKASSNFGIVPSVSYNNSYYPKSIITASTGSRSDHYHATQKPLALMDWIILSYSNPGDTVLDNTMGVGSTGVSAIKHGRRFVGMELSPEYYEIAKERIAALEPVGAILSHEKTDRVSEQMSLF